MIAAGAELNPKDKYKSPLLDAVYQADPAYVIALAEAGANVKIRFEDRSTLLHTPAQKGYAGVVKALLRFGADVNARDCFGRSTNLAGAWLHLMAIIPAFSCGTARHRSRAE
jgi:ankyrin repeat protein